MNSVCLVDTSIFCELLEVPNMSSRHKEVAVEFKAGAEKGVHFLLPLATILETGNHIGQNGDGDQRRKAADRFVQAVRAALDGKAPFRTVAFPMERSVLLDWLERFPDYAKISDKRGKGIGLGDVSIIHEFERQEKLNPGRRVYIWSLDDHLSSRDTGVR